MVDSTNFIPGEWISTHQGSGRLRGTPAGLNLHIVERFTRTDQNTLRHDVVDDPFTFEAPWRISMPMVRDDDYAMTSMGVMRELRHRAGVPRRARRRTPREIDRGRPPA